MICDLFFEVLSLILDSLCDIYDFANLLVLIPDHLLILFKDLSVRKLTSLVILTVFSADILLLLGSCCLLKIIFIKAALESSILLSQTSFNHIDQIIKLFLSDRQFSLVVF